MRPIMLQILVVRFQDKFGSVRQVSDTASYYYACKGQTRKGS